MQNFPNLLKLNSVCDLQTSDVESDTCNAVQVTLDNSKYTGPSLNFERSRVRVSRVRNFRVDRSVLNL